ncbi:MAG: hypothetical protein ACXV8Q_18235 [Methylobacter sp.]
MSQQILQSIGLPSDAALDIEELDIHYGAEIQTGCNIRMIILAVAEFVENQELWETLKVMGINYAQGYRISMPLLEIKQTANRN